ncbi:vesicle-associated protein 1-2-like isoform X1 [Impatiens glandulifera]|uniref:vesicle-associated protein 1-2-like isoform X1 n=1 Tax=Impatiens glandulifera TaxID=253017 RepID=UPI001FB0F5CF|nr:vesicle-associated protein 1-2-like isoform X1 [Impatiens glandulifera]
MTSEQELLTIEPLELKFPLELKKQISSSFQLLNKTDNFVAFKVKTTNPKKYSVRPNSGIVQPRSTCAVVVTMQALKEAPPDLQCKDRFLVQSVVANPGAVPKDVNAEMFDREAGKHVEESRLKVIYLSPHKPPSPVPEESEEGSPPRSFESEGGHSSHSEGVTASRDHKEIHDSSNESKTLYLKLAEEKTYAVEQNKRLRQELEMLKRGQAKTSGRIPILYVLLIGLIGLLLGYYMKS